MLNDKTTQYIESLLAQCKGDSRMDAFRREAQGQGIAVIKRDVEAFLSCVVLSAGCKSVLEAGSAVGYSACFFAHLIGDEAKVVSVERQSALCACARSNAERYGFSRQITFLNDDAYSAFRRLEEQKEQFDFVFLDAAKGQYLTLLDSAFALLKKGGMMVCDDVLFWGMISGEFPLVKRKITIVKRLRKFLPILLQDPRWQSTILPIGDGVSISVKL